MQTFVLNPFSVSPAGGSSTLNNGLVEYWKLDEASGNATGSVAGIVLTDTNTVGAATGLVHSSARDFEQSTSEMLSNSAGGAGAVAGLSTFSIAVWVQLESKTDFNGIFRSTNSNSFDLLYRDATRWRWTCAGTLQDLSVSTINTGQWYLLVVGYSDSGNTMFMSQNGAAKTSQANTSSNNTSANTFQIGVAGGGVYWDGLIGPVAVWNRILTDAEISELWNSGSGKPGPSF